MPGHKIPGHLGMFPANMPPAGIPEPGAHSADQTDMMRAIERMNRDTMATPVTDDAHR